MLKGLNKFNQFDVESFLENKVLLYLKAESWEERTESGDSVRSLGSKVSVAHCSGRHRLRPFKCYQLRRNPYR